MKTPTSLDRPDRARQLRMAVRRRRISGSAIVVGLVTLAVLSLIAAATFQTVSSRFRSNYQTASWHDALTSAEDGVSYAFTRLRAPLTTPDSSTSNTFLAGVDPLKVAGSLQYDLANYKDSTSTTTNGTFVTPSAYPRVQLRTLSIPHVGDGSRVFSAVATVDALSGVSSVNSWYRIQSVGTVPLAGNASVGIQKYDNLLRKLKFTDSSGNKLSRPQAVRTVEVIVKPVTIGSAALFGQTGINLNNQNVVIDSYDSRSTATSNADGTYNAAKATKSANVVTDDNPQSNGQPGVINLSSTGAYVNGNIATNNTPVSGSTDHVSGTVTEDFYQPLTNPPDPTKVSSSWTDYSLTAHSAGNTTPTMTTGTKDAPARYRMYDTLNKNSTDLSLSGTSELDIDATGGGYVEIWIPGNLSLTGQAQISLPSGVHATFYVDGNIDIEGKGVMNDSLLPTNLTLYGNHDPSVSQSVQIAGNGVFAGVLYAPNAAVSAKGSGNAGDIYGAIIANTIFFNGTTSLHYDQALADQGAVIDYRVASWYEDNALTR